MFSCWHFCSIFSSSLRGAFSCIEWLNCLFFIQDFMFSFCTAINELFFTISAVILLWSDKNEELLPQTLLGTERVAFTTLGSSRPLSLVILIHHSVFEIFIFRSIVWTIIILNHIPSSDRNVSHLI